MAEEEKKTDKSNDGWEINLRKWKRRDLNEFRKLAKTDDEDAVIPYYMRIIVKWPFDSDPSKVESYDEIDLVQWAEVNQQVANALKSLGDG